MNKHNLSPSAEYRHYKRELAVMALTDLPTQEAATICCAFIDEIAAGMPEFDPWESTREEAMYWADIAHPAELELYFAAALRALRNRVLGRQARKRLFMKLWRSFTDAERAAFVGYVNGRAA